MAQAYLSRICFPGLLIGVVVAGRGVADGDAHSAGTQLTGTQPSGTQLSSALRTDTQPVEAGAGAEDGVVRLAPEGCDAVAMVIERRSGRLPNGYRLVLYREYPEGEERPGAFQRFELLREGASVFCHPPREEGGAYRLWPHFLDESSQGAAGTVAQDVTGNGVPDVVMEEYSGGAHCCTTYTIVELFEGGPVVLPVLEAGHSSGRFVQADEDAALEFRMHDWAYAYYFACFAASPAPVVTLDLTYSSGSGYAWRFANSRVEMSAEVRDTLDEAAGRLRTHWDDRWETDAYPEFLRHYLDLIYFGQAAAAAKFLRDAFEGHDAERVAFLVDVALLLRENEYCQGILELNGCSTIGGLLSGAEGERE